MNVKTFQKIYYIETFTEQYRTTYSKCYAYRIQKQVPSILPYCVLI